MRKKTILLFLNLTLILTGCSKKDKLSNHSKPTNVCSANTLQIYDLLIPLAGSPTPRNRESRNSFRALQQDCQQLHREMGDQPCLRMNSSTGKAVAISYDQLTTLCQSPNQTREPSQGSVTRPSRLPTPTTTPNQSVRIEEVDGKFQIIFQKSRLETDDLTPSSVRLRCAFNFDVNSNRISTARSRVLSSSRTAQSQSFIYQIYASKESNQEAFSIICRSRSGNLLLEDLNLALRGVAIIKEISR